MGMGTLGTLDAISKKNETLLALKTRALAFSVFVNLNPHPNGTQKSTLSQPDTFVIVISWGGGREK